MKVYFWYIYSPYKIFFVGQSGTPGYPLKVGLFLAEKYTKITEIYILVYFLLIILSLKQVTGLKV